MKKLSLLIFLFAIGVSTLFAQTIVIKGTVTSATEGPIPGATVQVKGTTLGAISDANGKYSLSVPKNATTLVFSYVGMKKKEVEIGGLSVIDVTMESDILSLEEVVVTTGYGIKRAPKSTSALTQVVSGDKLNEVRQTDVNNALAGKISGIQLRGTSTVALDRTGSVRLRGDGGFSTGSEILYVVDGTVLPNSSDLNMDDIEDISVLSGPSACAILGSQGANGAIIITTKKAKMSGEKTMAIEVNTGVLTSSVYILPSYQNEYAGGNTNVMTKYSWKPGDPVEWKTLDGKYYPNYSDDSSWGPRMEGQEYIPWYSWYPGSKYTGTTAKLVPQPNNVRDFYDRGWSYNNNISFSKAGDNYNIRAIIGNIAVKGNIPETSLNKTTFALKVSYDMTKKLTFAANVNFFSTLTNGQFNELYVNQSSGSFNQWFHRDLNMNIMRELKNLRTPDGIYASWNHNDPTLWDPSNPKLFYAANYWYNFFTYFDLVRQPSRSDRLFGDFSLTYKILEGLSVKVTYRRQQNNTWNEEMYSSDLFYSQTQATSILEQIKNKGYYSSSTGYSNRENFESLISYSKQINDFKINTNLGSDFFNAVLRSNSENTVNGLVVPSLFTISNSVDQPNIVVGKSAEKYRAIFARGDIGFRDFLFGEFTLRNDWFSELPPSNNSVLSKSFGGSFIFSDLLKLPYLDFGKVRASWGEIPTTIGIYSYPGFVYNIGQYKWNGNLVMSTPDQLVDPDIHGAVKTQKEVGLELRFFRSKVGFMATYWDGSEKNIPLPISISSYSGFTSKYLNIGQISRQGLDLSLNLKAITTPYLAWELNAQFSYLLKDQVDKIAPGVESFTVQALFFNGVGGTPVMKNAIGRPWGELFGSGMKMYNGLPLLNADGSYISDPQKYFGGVLPKYTGGIQNSFRILKNITLNVNFDYQFGGKFFSSSEVWGTFSGITAQTAGLNDKGNPIRDPVTDGADGGGVHVKGYDLTTHDPVEYYIDAQTYFHNLYNIGIFDPFVHTLSYVKLRELSIGYNIPVKKIGELNKYVQGINVSLVAQNMWLIYSGAKGFDPSEISDVSGETGQFPSVRSWGMNLRVNF
jgi:TonB-linked SusC/RagA family outer membrane protein